MITQKVQFTIVHTSTNKHHFDNALRGEEILYYSTEPVIVGPLREKDFAKGFYVPPEKIKSLYEMLEAKASPNDIVEKLGLARTHKSVSAVCLELEEKANEERYNDSPHYGDDYVPIERYVEVEVPPMFQGGGCTGDPPLTGRQQGRYTVIMTERQYLNRRGVVGIQPQYDPNKMSMHPPWPCTDEDMEY